jgi:hypothetical protein
MLTAIVARPTSMETTQWWWHTCLVLQITEGIWLTLSRTNGGSRKYLLLLIWPRNRLKSSRIHSDIVHNETAAYTIFNETLAKALETSEQQMNVSFRIGAVSVPDHFNSSSKSVVMHALRDNGTPFGWMMRVLSSYHGSILTFPRSQCQDRFIQPPSDGIDDDAHVLLVDKSFDTISVRSAEFGFGGQWSLDPIEISDIDREFLPVAKESMSKLPRNFENAVISGDFNVPTAKRLWQSLQALDPEIAAKKGDGDLQEPSNVKAIGAACIARSFERHPEIIEDVYVKEGMSLPADHDEL